MNAGVYVVSVAVSAMYFIGPDNRIKYFPKTIDLISDGINTTEPVGLVSVECVETKKHVVQAFRVKSGFDIHSLLSIASSPGVLGISPERVIISESLRSVLSVPERKSIKAGSSIKEIAFTKMLTPLAQDLPKYSFESEYFKPGETRDVTSFLTGINTSEYQRSIHRSVQSLTRNELVAEIRDLRPITSVRISIPKSDWRTPEGASAPGIEAQCAVVHKSGVVDMCEVVSTRGNSHGRTPSEEDFERYYRENFHDDDDDDDDELDDEDDNFAHERGRDINLSVENMFYLLHSVQSIVCSEHGWQEHDIDSDIINFILDENEYLGRHTCEALREIVDSDGIYNGLDSENIAWPFDEVAGDIGASCVFQIIPRSKAQQRVHYLLSLFEDGTVHLYVIEDRFFDFDTVIESLGVGEVTEFVQVSVAVKTQTTITNLIKLAKTPETMEAALTLITEILKGESEVIDEWFAEFC